MNKKKSQMEILGLAILFVLMIFGFLLYVMFSAGDSDLTTKDEYLQPKMLSSMLSSIMKTTVKCGEATYSITDLLKDDQTYNSIRCDFDGDIKNSKYIAKNLTKEALKQTFERYKWKYFFNVTIGTDEIFDISYKDCNHKSRSYKTVNQPIQLPNGQTLEVVLARCN